jgi:hypothetical protein
VHAQQAMADYLAHLAHALKVCGEDHVGIGSDALLTPFDTSLRASQRGTRRSSRIAPRASARPTRAGPFVVGLNRPSVRGDRRLGRAPVTRLATAALQGKQLRSIEACVMMRATGRPRPVIGIEARTPIREDEVK